MRLHPTKNQAKTIVKILRNRDIERGNHNNPKPWAVIDGRELIVGRGDTPQSRPTATTWQAAQEYIASL